MSNGMKKAVVTKQAPANMMYVVLVCKYSGGVDLVGVYNNYEKAQGVFQRVHAYTVANNLPQVVNMLGSVKNETATMYDF